MHAFTNYNNTAEYNIICITNYTVYTYYIYPMLQNDVPCNQCSKELNEKVLRILHQCTELLDGTIHMLRNALQ